MKKFTKIVATIGPVSGNEEKIGQLYHAGMDVVRINMSHGDKDSVRKYIDAIRNESDCLGIMLDTKGPEIRTGDVENGSIRLREGDRLVLTPEACMGTPNRLFIDYPQLNQIPDGCAILIDDGLIETQVIGKKGDELIVKVRNGSVLGSQKTVSIIDYNVKLPFLKEADKEDILFGIENNISLIAASFVRCKEDVRQLRSLLIRHNSNAMIISKIEHGEAVRNIDEIIRESDGIMIARGDLGVELPLEKVPKIQADIIRACNQQGKPVIVATQMLESMRENPRPTRAEVSDIAQAILQGADAIMLSAETATGKYPVKAVETMVKIAREYDPQVSGVIHQTQRHPLTGEDSVARFVAKAAYYGSEDLNTRAILTPTESGFTARNVSRFKPKCPILATTRDMNVLRQLMLSWGVTPILEQEQFTNTDDLTNSLVLKSYEKGMIDGTDTIVITSGSKLLEKGGTNHLEIYAVKDILERIQKR